MTLNSNPRPLYFGVHLLAIIMAAQAGLGDVLHVPDDYPTIQEAIDASSNGDEIVVAPGTYNEALNLLGREITLRSSDGADVTVLDGAELGTSVMRATGGETLNTIVDGFTFTRGEGSALPSCESANGSGGAIYLGSFSGLTVINCDFIENAIDEDLTAGGAICVLRGELRVDSCAFERNGGYVTDPEFATAYGAAIYVCNPGFSADLEVTNSVFTENGPAAHGGGIYAIINGDVTVSNCQFLLNDASHGGGVNIYDQYRNTTAVTDCTFEGNVSSHGGGMVIRSDGTVSVAHCDFTNNDASFGGGLNLSMSAPSSGTSHGEVTDCRFVGNRAGKGGGAVGVVSSDSPDLQPRAELFFTGCMFVGNEAGDCCNTGLWWSECYQDGPGRYVGGAADLRTFYGGLIRLVNCLASGNSGGVGGGFALTTCGGGDIELINGTVAGNERSGVHARLGLAATQTDSAVDIANTVAWNNGTTNDDQLIIRSDGGPMLSTSVTYCNVQGGWSGDGNINADPLFADMPNGDYHLLAGSPCIDAGDNTAVPTGVSTDLDGMSRFLDDPDAADTGNGTAPIVDIGAYEFAGAPCDPCDANCDGEINSLDIEPFINLLVGGGSGCDACTGDVDRNGEVNTLDIEPFVECLLGP
jgi:hypothetical protein